MQTELLPSYGTERYYLLSEIEQKTTFVFLDELSEIRLAAITLNNNNNNNKKKKSQKQISLSYAILDYAQATSADATLTSEAAVENATAPFLLKMLELRDRGTELVANPGDDVSMLNASVLFVEVRISPGVEWIDVKARVQTLMARLSAGMLFQ